MKGWPWSRIIPQLLSGADVLAGEESHAGEAQVLVWGEHAAREQVRLTQVIDEAADVAVETGVYTVHITYLQNNRAPQLPRHTKPTI